MEYEVAPPSASRVLDETGQHVRELAGLVNGMAQRAGQDQGVPNVVAENAIKGFQAQCGIRGQKIVEHATSVVEAGHRIVAIYDAADQEMADGTDRAASRSGGRALFGGDR
ncbi:hypothetical protein [Myceligenerans crystallogenes]